MDPNADNAYYDCENYINGILSKENNKKLNTNNTSLHVKPKRKCNCQTLKFKRSNSCPLLTLKQEDYPLPEISDDSKSHLSEQILTLAIEACSAGERIGKENQRRFCLKNIQILCSKTKEHLKNTEVTKTHPQDTQLELKNYIFSFIRILDGWKCLEEVLKEKHDAYETIENEYYSPNIRYTFCEWQSSTKDLLQEVYETFQTVNKSVQIDKLQSKLSKMGKEVINNVRPNQTFTNIKSQMKNDDKSSETFSNSLLCSICNIETHTSNITSYEKSSSQIVNPQICEVPSYVKSLMFESKSNSISQNDFENSDFTKNWQFYSQWFFDENSDKHSKVNNHKSSLFDNQWEAALQSAPILVKTILNNELSPIHQCNIENKKVKKKNIRNEIKKIGNILLHFFDVELLSKVTNQNLYKAMEYRSMRKNSVTLSDIRNKLKKNHYNSIGDILKDIERIFFSIIEYLQMQPDEDLEKTIVYIREKFWKMVRDDLKIID